MAKSLSQAQIDAMFGGSEGGSGTEAVDEFDFSSQRSLNAEQNQEISDLCERFARGLSSGMAAWLKADVNVSLVAVERASFAELMESATEKTTYFSALQFDSVSALSLLQLDIPLGYCVLDLLLGGSGKPTHNHELTHVDEQLFQAVMSFAADELSNAWRGVGLVARCLDRLIHTQITRLMPSDEQALCLMFEMRVGEAQGNLVLTLPAAVSSFLLRQLAGAWKGRREHPAALRERLLQLSRKINYWVTLQLPASTLTYADIEDMKVGEVLLLKTRDSVLPHLRLAGRSLCEAAPMAKGIFRAAEIGAAVPQE